jgi:hypothetical protein
MKKFPSYFCSFKTPDSLAVLPYALLKLELEESGKVISVAVVKSTLPGFASQIQSAALWGEYIPMLVDGKPVATSCFLLALFLPQLKYPAAPIDAKADSMVTWYDKWRVRIIADTVGLLNPAMPKVQGIDELTIMGEDRYLMGVVNAGLAIDVNGNVRFTGSDTKQDKLNNAVKASIEGLRFYPAVSFAGEVKSFSGTARFKFSNRANVRVDYLWLEN